MRSKASAERRISTKQINANILAECILYINTLVSTSSPLAEKSGPAATH